MHKTRTKPSGNMQLSKPKAEKSIAAASIIIRFFIS